MTDEHRDDGDELNPTNTQDSLLGVLSSLKSLLGHEERTADEASERPPEPENSPEPFQYLPAEQYDDPLALGWDDDAEQPDTNETSVSPEPPVVEIPVLEDIVSIPSDTAGDLSETTARRGDPPVLEEAVAPDPASSGLASPTEDAPGPATASTEFDRESSPSTPPQPEALSERLQAEIRPVIDNALREARAELERAVDTITSQMQASIHSQVRGRLQRLTEELRRRGHIDRD